MAQLTFGQDISRATADVFDDLAQQRQQFQRLKRLVNRDRFRRKMERLSHALTTESLNLQKEAAEFDRMMALNELSSQRKRNRILNERTKGLTKFTAEQTENLKNREPGDEFAPETKANLIQSELKIRRREKERIQEDIDELIQQIPKGFDETEDVRSIQPGPGQPTIRVPTRELGNPDVRSTLFRIMNESLKLNQLEGQINTLSRQRDRIMGLGTEDEDQQPEETQQEETTSFESSVFN